MQVLEILVDFLQNICQLFGSLRIFHWARHSFLQLFHNKKLTSIEWYFPYPCCHFSSDIWLIHLCIQFFHHFVKFCTTKTANWLHYCLARRQLCIIWNNKIDFFSFRPSKKTNKQTNKQKIMFLIPASLSATFFGADSLS